MAEFFKQGEKIECNASEVIAKDIVPSVPQKHPKIGLTLKYSCKRDGSAEIKKELNPKKYKINKDSNLELGDKLRANLFYVLVEGIKKIKPTKLGGHSGRHNSQIFNTNKFTYAEISKPFEHIVNALEKRKEIEKS